MSLAALALIVGLMPLILFYTCRASKKAVHIYSFNIPSEDLKAAYALLDKEPQRRSMRSELDHPTAAQFLMLF